jgi:hypothetical protein
LWEAEAATIDQTVQRATSPSVSEATRHDDSPSSSENAQACWQRGRRGVPTETGGPVTDLLEINKIRTMVMATVIEVMMIMMMMMMIMIMR